MAERDLLGPATEPFEPFEPDHGQKTGENRYPKLMGRQGLQTEEPGKSGHVHQRYINEGGGPNDPHYQVVLIGKGGKYGIVKGAVDQGKEDVGSDQNGECHGAGKGLVVTLLHSILIGP